MLLLAVLLLLDTSPNAANPSSSSPLIECGPGQNCDDNTTLAPNTFPVVHGGSNFTHHLINDQEIN